MADDHFPEVNAGSTRLARQCLLKLRAAQLLNLIHEESQNGQQSHICRQMLLAVTVVVFEVVAVVFQGVESFVVSSPWAPPPQALAERYVNLSIHTAPIRQTHLPFLLANEQTDGDSASLFPPEVLKLGSCDGAKAYIYALPISPVLC